MGNGLIGGAKSTSNNTPREAHLTHATGKRSTATLDVESLLDVCLHVFEEGKGLGGDKVAKVLRHRTTLEMYRELAVSANKVESAPTSSISLFKHVGLPIFFSRGAVTVPYCFRFCAMRRTCRSEIPLASAISLASSRRKSAAVICSRWSCVSCGGIVDELKTKAPSREPGPADQRCRNVQAYGGITVCRLSQILSSG